MKSLQDLQNIKFWQTPTKTPSSRLFLYSDGFQLTAAVIACVDNRLTIQATAQSSETPGSALQEVLATLNSKLDEVPQRAIMLHSRIALGLLNLPVTENNQLDDNKVANIVRWEMETLFNEQAPQWQIGSLLVQLGIISEQERDDIVERLQQHRHRAASFGGKLQRFGEIVVEMGRLDNEELEHYLNLQSELQEGDNHFKCGWHTSAGGEEIFCAAMSQHEMQRWMEAFAESSLRIDRFYPLAGTVAALLENDTRVCLLELHPMQLVCSILHEGCFQQMEIVNCVDRSLTVEDVVLLLQRLQAKQHKLVLWGSHPRTEALCQQLQQQCEEPLLQLTCPPNLVNNIDSLQQQPMLMPLLGVARDYFFQTLQQGRVPYVQGMAPPLSWYKQSRWQWTAAASVLLLVLLTYDLTLQGRLSASQDKIAQLEKGYKDQRKDNKRLKRDNRRFAKLDKELQQLERDYDNLQRRKKAIEENLIQRQKFMQELLTILVNSVDEEVVLEGLSEENWYHFRLNGWALNQAAIHRFDQKLNRQLSSYNMRVSHSPSNLVRNGELSGAYRFNFELVRKKPVKDKKKTS